MGNYTQKALWLGTIIGDASTQEFEEFFKEEFGCNVKYNEEFQMTGEYDGMHSIIFSIHSKDITKFAMLRLTTIDMKWFEDWVDNHYDSVPQEILAKYDDYLNS